MAKYIIDGEVVSGSTDTASSIKCKDANGNNSNVQAVLDEQNKNLTASDNTKFRFATDGEGNYGYLKADDSFVPFKSGDSIGTFYIDNVTITAFDTNGSLGFEVK